MGANEWLANLLSGGEQYVPEKSLLVGETSEKKKRKRTQQLAQEGEPSESEARPEDESQMDVVRQLALDYFARTMKKLPKEVEEAEQAKKKLEQTKPNLGDILGFVFPPLALTGRKMKAIRKYRKEKKEAEQAKADAALILSSVLQGEQSVHVSEATRKKKVKALEDAGVPHDTAVLIAYGGIGALGKGSKTKKETPQQKGQAKFLERYYALLETGAYSEEQARKLATQSLLEDFGIIPKPGAGTSPAEERAKALARKKGELVAQQPQDAFLGAAAAVTGATGPQLQQFYKDAQKMAADFLTEKSRGLSIGTDPEVDIEIRHATQSLLEGVTPPQYQTLVNRFFFQKLGVDTPEELANLITAAVLDRVPPTVAENPQLLMDQIETELTFTIRDVLRNAGYPDAVIEDVVNTVTGTPGEGVSYVLQEMEKNGLSGLETFMYLLRVHLMGKMSQFDVDGTIFDDTLVERLLTAGRKATGKGEGKKKSKAKKEK